MSESGSGTERDIPEAIRYMEQAAKQGYIEAQNALGMLYMSGKEVLMDAEKAWHC